MTSPDVRRRPPLDGDERAQLTGWLRLQREIVHFKCAGLSDQDAHRVVVPTSPLLTVAGIVSHLRWVENTWFTVLYAGDESASPPFDEDDPDHPDPDFRTDGAPLARLLAEYAEQCARSDAVIAAHDLGEPGRHPDDAARASLRWMLTHMVEETARHAGHLDLLRELLDGGTGYY